MTDGAGIDFLRDAAGSAEVILAAASDLVRAGLDEALAHAHLLDPARLDVVPLRQFYSPVLPFAERERGFDLLRRLEACNIVFIPAP